MNDQVDQQDPAVTPEVDTFDAEGRAGVALWRAVADPGWRPSRDNLLLMSRVPTTPRDVVSLMEAALGRHDVPLKGWHEGWEALLEANLHQAESLELLSRDVVPKVRRVVLWGLVRHKVIDPSFLDDDALHDIAVAFVHRGVPSPQLESQGFWQGFDHAWPAARWWTTVARVVAEEPVPVTGSSRLRPCAEHVPEQRRLWLLVRLYDASPRWALARILEGGGRYWDELLRLADRVIHEADVEVAEGQQWGDLAPALAAALAHMAQLVQRDLDPSFFAQVVQKAVARNRRIDAVPGVLAALEQLPLEARQRLMLETPFLRWRYVSACPSQTVLEWAIGELSGMSHRKFQVQRDLGEESRFHHTATFDTFQEVAADALAGVGEAGVQFLVEGMSRAGDLNRRVFASALVHSASPQAIEPLVVAFEGGSHQLRETIRAGFGVYENAALPVLEPMLRSNRRGTRLAGAELLEALPPNGEVRDVARAALVDEDVSEVRSKLQRICDAQGRSEAELALLEAEHRLARSLRRTMLDALAATDGGAWSDYEDVGVAGLAVVQKWAQGQLVITGEEPLAWLDAIVAFRDDPATGWVVARLADHPAFHPSWLMGAGRILGSALYRPLKRRVDVADPHRLRLLLHVLAVHAPAAAVSTFLRYLSSTDPGARAACHLGLRSAGERSLEGLWDMLEHPEHRIRQEAAKVLERIPDPRSVVKLRECLEEVTDPGVRWVVQRALVVCQEVSDHASDRLMDAILAEQKAGRLPGFVVDLGLTTLRYRSGVKMSAEARVWMLSAIHSASRKVDWFLPLKHSARLLWALRHRLSLESLVTLRSELAHMAASPKADRHAVRLFMTFVDALFATDEEIELLADRIESPEWSGPVDLAKDISFPGGDPRVLFLRGTPAALLRVAAWSERASEPLVHAWSRAALRRLASVLGTQPSVVVEVARKNAGESSRTHAEWLSQALTEERVLQLGEIIREDDAAFRGVVSRVVFDSLDEHGRRIHRFHLRDGLEPEDVEGAPVPVGHEVRVSHPDSFADTERRRWAQRLGGMEQPIEQLFAPRREGGELTRRDTGWLVTREFLARAGRLGYAHELPEHGVAGGERDYPPAPLSLLTRMLSETWGLELRHNELKTWRHESTDPSVLRVLEAHPIQRPFGPESPWRRVAIRRTPGWVISALAADLAVMDQGSDAAGTGIDVVGGGPSVVEVAIDDDFLEEEESLVEEIAFEDEEPLPDLPPPPEKPSGLFGRLFAARHEALVKERNRMIEERREMIRQRQRAAKARREAAQAAAVHNDRVRRTRQQRVVKAQKTRWDAVQATIEEARASLDQRRQVAHELRVLQRTQVIKEAPSHKLLQAIFARELRRDAHHEVPDAQQGSGAGASERTLWDDFDAGWSGGAQVQQELVARRKAERARRAAEARAEAQRKLEELRELGILRAESAGEEPESVDEEAFEVQRPVNTIFDDGWTLDDDEVEVPVPAQAAEGSEETELGDDALDALMADLMHDDAVLETPASEPVPTDEVAGDEVAGDEVAADEDPVFSGLDASTDWLDESMADAADEGWLEEDTAETPMAVPMELLVEPEFDEPTVEDVASPVDPELVEQVAEELWADESSDVAAPSDVTGPLDVVEAAVDDASDEQAGGEAGDAFGGEPGDVSDDGSDVEDGWLFEAWDDEVEDEADIEAAMAEEDAKAAAAAVKEAERKAAEEDRLRLEREAALEAARLEAERKAAEEAARLEAERKAAEEARLEAERKAAEEARLEAERKAAEEARLEAERKAAEEARLEAERKAAEEARLEAERKAAEEARLEAERKAAEEAARLEAERKAAEEKWLRTMATEATKREEQATALWFRGEACPEGAEAREAVEAVAEDVSRAERQSVLDVLMRAQEAPLGALPDEGGAVADAAHDEANSRSQEELAAAELADQLPRVQPWMRFWTQEEARRVRQALIAESERLDAERKAAEEARLEAERKAAEEAARLEAERKAAEEAARLEAERKAAEEARIEAERKAAEEAARLEAERKAAEEARLEAERKAAEEARLEAERKAAEEAARLEAERKAAEEARLEAERKAAEEAARLEAERKAAEEARLEAERKAAEEAARLEAERKAAEEAARLEAERKAAEEARLEAERKAAEEAARLEAERKAAEEAARLEAERKAAEEAARLEAERKAAEEAARLEAERKAAEEARLEAERKAAEEAARLEAERKAEEEARLEAERKAAETARLEAERKAAQEAAQVETLAAASDAPDAWLDLDGLDTDEAPRRPLPAALVEEDEEDDPTVFDDGGFRDDEPDGFMSVEVEYEETEDTGAPLDTDERNGWVDLLDDT